MRYDSYFRFLLTEARCFYFVFFFNDTATTEIYTLSLHDALPISAAVGMREAVDTVDLARESLRRRTPDLLGRVVHAAHRVEDPHLVARAHPPVASPVAHEGPCR